LTAVTARHEALRTRFGQVEGEPVQIVDPPPSGERAVELPAIDLGALPAAAREAALLGFCRAEAGWRFDFARGPLARAVLVRLGEADHALLLTLHHIVADGWSIGVLLRELAAFYREAVGGGPADLPPLAVQYADYAVWQRAWLQGDVLERQLAFWRERLAGAPAALELPIDRPRPALRTTNGARLPVALGAELSAAVRQLARTARATPFMVFLAAFQELLGRVSGRQDLTVGTPVANRNRVEVEGLIGFFVNTLVLRADLAGNPAVRQRIERSREGTLAAYTHQDVPFEKLVEELHPERSLAVTPLFQVLFTLESPPPPPRLPGLEAAPVEVDSGVAKFDLSLALSNIAEKSASEIAGALEYNTDLFDAATAARLAGHLRTLIAAFAAGPDRPVAELPVLSGPERHQIVAEWNDTRRIAADPVAEATLHRLFARQAARTPEAVAVVFDGEPMTYAELDALSNRLAHRLRGLGVGPEVPVGVLMERTLEMVVAILGVLKAGGAYVPLDPAYPQERLAWTLGDCRAPVVLTQEWLAERLPENAGRPVFLDASWEALEGAPEEPPVDRALPGNLAYLIYTSGSTGRPKGVAIEHRNAAALLAWAGEAFSAAELAGVLASTSLCFDLSVFELFVPLARGGRVMLAESALDLMALGGSARVALVNTVPSAAAELARAGALPASVRTLNLAGEPIPAALVERLASQQGLERVWNLYGPSEATTYSTAYQVLPAVRPERRSPPIGRPIAGTSVLVLDRLLRPVPIGVPGELYVAGEGLARGYFGRPELTAASFRPHPWDETAGSRVYKTGDLGRLLPDGNFEFLRRIDQQVKVRGFRIELEEIEAALARHPAVAQTAAAVREDVAGDRRLVAYVVPRTAGAEPEPGELRSELQRTLPEFMVPALFVTLPALPLTANGKVDRAALPAPEAVRPKVYVEPETALERAIAEVVATALGVERVGRHDNFFDLGGHSLLMIRAAGLIEQRLGHKVQVLELFRFSTVAALAAHLAAAAGIATAREELSLREELEKRFETRRRGRERRRELRQNLR
jgi:amino acid adenylation domain-containing protein